MLKRIKNGRPIIVIAIAIILISVICHSAGTRQMNAAKEEYGRAFNDTYYYWPGEVMRDRSQAGIVFGVCILIWGGALEYKRKKDNSGTPKVVDLLEEEK